MNSSNEDGTEHDPQQCWKPSPKHRDRRADDWARTGDACKMMAENHFFFGWNEIDVVLKLLTGNDRVGVESENLASEPTSICVIGNDKPNERSNCD